MTKLYEVNVPEADAHLFVFEADYAANKFHAIYEDHAFGADEAYVVEVRIFATYEAAVAYVEALAHDIEFPPAIGEVILPFTIG